MLKDVLQAEMKGCQLVTQKHMKIQNSLIKISMLSNWEYSNNVKSVCKYLTLV